MLARWLAGAVFACAIALGSAAAEAAFESPQLAAQAASYGDALAERAATAASQASKPRPPAELSALAEAAVLAGRWSEAQLAFEGLVGQKPDDFATWLSLAHALAQQDQTSRGEQAVAAAYRAYTLAGSDQDRVDALRELAPALERRALWDLAIAAYDEIVALAPGDTQTADYRDYLRRQHEFSVIETNVDTERDAPQICLTFNQQLADPNRVHFLDYVRIKPEVPVEAFVSADQLCLEGVAFGQTYEVTALAGLPSAQGERLKRDDTSSQTVGDRSPTVGFRARTYVLPATGEGTVPLTTVNIDKVALRLLHINDRNLVREVVDDRIGQVLSGWDIDQIADTYGEVVWQGEMPVDDIANKSVTTGVPIRNALPDTSPGIYILSARDANETDEWVYNDRGTQWLVVTDLGLASFSGADGLHVAVRSLDSAAARPGVRVDLLARNNTVLGTATSDENGVAAFAAGLTGGTGGNAPAALLAYDGTTDFNFLELTGPAFDLSDRGVSGRSEPGPMDAYLYTERGVYRAGETVHLTALLRDDRARAVRNLPLTLKLIRPDEVEAARVVVTDQGGGSYAYDPELPPTARTGTWTVEAYLDPDAAPIGLVRFGVQDFVPQRIRLDLQSPAGALTVGEAGTIEANAQYLYGAAATDLPGEAELVLQPAADPFPAYPGFHFGLVQESFQPHRISLDVPPTDAQGLTAIDAEIDSLPDTSLPLEANIRLSLFDVGGRPVNQTMTLPVHGPGPWIGLRSRQGNEVPEGDTADFDVITLDGDGQRIALAGLQYQLVEENYNYYWYSSGSSWDYRVVIQDRPVASGTLDVAADAPALVSEPLDWGRYRLDVFDPASGAASSVRLTAGWWVSPVASDTPDKVTVTLDQPAYGAGDTMQVHLEPPFAGRVLLMVANQRVLATRDVEVPEGGTTVELPVGADWGPGAYVLATAFRPTTGTGPRQGPTRAVGVAYFAMDMAERTLSVAIDAPAEIQPRQTIDVPVTVAGADPGEKVWVTLAAVDEGILLLTDYASPDPADYFYGKRALGVELRDAYGRLIVSEGRRGAIRSGGDGDQLRALPVQIVKTVALFSGILAVDAGGRAVVPLDIPDYNGELRLMAVAWTDDDEVGHADRALTIRDPLVAELALPRFLAPGDVAKLALSLHNVAGPAGSYTARLSAEGAIHFESAPDLTADLAADQRLQRTVTLAADGPGTGTIALALAGPGGFSVTRHWDIAVRPAQAAVTERQVATLAAGDSLQIGPALTAGYLSDTLDVKVEVSSGPNFDIPGLLRDLDQYPYGCIEQTTSRALPLLYLDEVAARIDDPARADDVQRRVQRAIDRVMSMQRADGSFGFWSSQDQQDPWQTTYAMDFLTRAREQGYAVPESTWNRGIRYLQDFVNQWYTRDQCDPVAAYALFDLARAGATDIADLRYYLDNCLARFETPIAKAQLGAALAAYGDTVRADTAFEAATGPRPDSVSHYDYGSALRDRAAVTALMAEAGWRPDVVAQQADQAADLFAASRWHSTQEEGWLLLAAHALLGKQHPLDLAVNGVPAAAADGPFILAPTLAEVAAGITIDNRGDDMVHSAVSVRGVPVDPVPAEQDGFTLLRRFYDMDGNPIDLSAGTVRQNQLIVVTIEGASQTELDQQALIVDLLPAGLEIENPLVGEGQGIDSLSTRLGLTGADHVELRDDRFVAAVHLQEGVRDFKVGYVARAVTPGLFAQPAAFVEDMYRPQYHARTELGQLAILPRG